MNKYENNSKKLEYGRNKIEKQTYNIQLACLDYFLERYIIKKIKNI